VEKTIPGETQATWAIDNTLGLALNITLASGTNWQTADINRWANSSRASSGFGFIAATGTTNFAATVNSQFFLTGVQVEKGTLATEFERRPYGVEILLCQRYYNVFLGGRSFSSIQMMGRGNGTVNTSQRTNIKLSTAMRLLPIIEGVGSFNLFPLANDSTAILITVSDLGILSGESSLDNVGFFINSAGKYWTTFVGGVFNLNSSNSALFYLAYNAEL